MAAVQPHLSQFHLDVPGISSEINTITQRLADNIVLLELLQVFIYAGEIDIIAFHRHLDLTQNIAFA